MPIETIQGGIDMLEVYKINYKNHTCGYLEYDSKKDEFRATLTVDPKELEFPIMLFSKIGLKNVGDARVRRYIKAVTIPKSRDNISDILRSLGLKSYSEWEIYKVNKGLNSNDYASIIKIDK